MPADTKDQRLFHYTQEFAWLSDMLTNGLWPRYCVEEFDWLLGRFTCIAFPVVCFCDIPIAAGTAHRDRYGDYAIAVSKDRTSIYDINPVWYVAEGTSIQKHLSDAVHHPVRVTLDTIPPMIKPILPFLKSTIGAQPDRGSTNVRKLELLAFEEELEWRYTPASLMDTWKFGHRREIVGPSDHDASLASRLVLNHADIENVFVRTNDEVAALITSHPLLAGKIGTWP